MLKKSGILTPEDVAAEVDKIRDRAVADFEAAHALEVDLFHAVLRFIAAGRCEDPEACCREAIKSRRIKFLRAMA